MKRPGCLLSGCLGLGAALAVLVVITLLFMAHNPPLTVPVAGPPATPTPVVPITSATDNTSGGIILMTAQMADNTPRPTVLTQPLSTATPAAPVAAPFFSSQTAAAKQSATVMWIARTAWFGALTQGAIDHAATLQTLGTPER